MKKKVLLKYLKMLIPSFGIFTNGFYTFKGFTFLGYVFGKCIKTKFTNIYEISKYYRVKQYHLRENTKLQFNNPLTPKGTKI